MRRIGQMVGRSRWKITAAMLAGILNMAACGAVPDEGKHTETRASALSVGTIQDLLDALTNNPTGDIVLTSDLWAPDGFAWHVGYFAGTLDGGMNGRTISNLTISDTIGQSAGMFVYAEFATIKNLKLVNLQVTGTYGVGGLVGDCVDCTIESVAVEGALSAPNYVGGIVGGMSGGSIRQSYFKGTVTDGAWGAGGLVGLTSSTDAGFAAITSSYAQATNQTATLVAGSTDGGTHPAGGIVGAGSGMWLSDVYAIGKVTGRGSVGGLIGQPTCDDVKPWVLGKGIYRGDATDVNFPASPNGWSGTLGQATDLNCNSRSTKLYFNRELDRDMNFLSVDQRPSTGRELITPTAPTVANGGIFCPTSNTLIPCGDDPFATPPWDFGTGSQHNILADMPGPNTQLR